MKISDVEHEFGVIRLDDLQYAGLDGGFVNAGIAQ
jgi:hypothetical protein